ncbi:MAG TPA: hypothetical protein VH814_08165 [Steroidobacteraceae bacterium]|jgi:hypothetical protein
MKSTGFLRVAALALSLCLTFAAARAEKIDPALQGIWNLDVAHSKFGPDGKPRSGQVNWGAHGFSFALVFANGELFTDAVATDNGCAYVGASPLTCVYSVINPRHVRLTIKEGDQVTRVGDIELLPDGTTRTTHRVTPTDRPAYVETTVWIRQKE